MIIRPAFASFIQQSAGVTQPKVGEIPDPVQSDAEQYTPVVAEKMAGYYSKINTPLSEEEVSAIKKPMAEMLDQHPQAFEALATVTQAACPESSMPVGFQAGPEVGIFSLEMNQVNPFGNNFQGDKVGVLYVDTTPQQEGIQYFFQACE